MTTAAFKDYGQWKDVAAINVILHTERLRLLKELDIHRQSLIMMHFEDTLNDFEMDYICSPSLRCVRVKRFIEKLAMKMTTELFVDFLISLDEYPDLRKTIHDAYMRESEKYVMQCMKLLIFD